MGIIKRLFGGRAAERDSQPSSPFPAPESRHPATATREDARRELVKAVLRDIRRAHGIPANWIDCEVLSLPPYKGESRMFATLLILHWDERLLKYALAIQRRFSAEIVKLDPSAPRWLQGIAWQFASDADCPFLEMPAPDAWLDAVAPPVPKVDLLDRRKAKRGNRNQRKAGNEVAGEQPSRQREEDFEQTRRIGL
jgi:hypothetical protein